MSIRTEERPKREKLTKSSVVIDVDKLSEVSDSEDEAASLRTKRPKHDTTGLKLGKPRKTTKDALKAMHELEPFPLESRFEEIQPLLEEFLPQRDWSMSRGLIQPDRDTALLSAAHIEVAALLGWTTIVYAKVLRKVLDSHRNCRDQTALPLCRNTVVGVGARVGPKPIEMLFTILRKCGWLGPTCTRDPIEQVIPLREPENSIDQAELQNTLAIGPSQVEHVEDFGIEAVRSSGDGPDTLAAAEWEKSSEGDEIGEEAVPSSNQQLEIPQMLMLDNSIADTESASILRDARTALMQTIPSMAHQIAMALTYGEAVFAKVVPDLDPQIHGLDRCLSLTLGSNQDNICTESRQRLGFSNGGLWIEALLFTAAFERMLSAYSSQAILWYPSLRKGAELACNLTEPALTSIMSKESNIDSIVHGMQHMLVSVVPSYLRHTYGSQVASQICGKALTTMMSELVASLVEVDVRLQAAHVSRVQLTWPAPGSAADSSTMECRGKDGVAIDARRAMRSDSKVSFSVCPAILYHTDIESNGSGDSMPIWTSGSQYPPTEEGWRLLSKALVVLDR